MIHSFITQYNVNFTRQDMKQSWISCCCQETAEPRVLCIDLRGNSQESDTGLEQSVSKKDQVMVTCKISRFADQIEFFAQLRK